MSAPSLAISALPSVGHAAAARRGAATADADFAAILDGTAPPEAPVRTTAPAKHETDAAADPVSPSADDTAPDADTNSAPVTAEAAAPVPLTVPTLPAAAEITTEAAGPSPVAGEATPALPVTPVAPAAPDAVEGAAPVTDASPVPPDDRLAAWSAAAAGSDAGPEPSANASTPAAVRNPDPAPATAPAALSVDLQDGAAPQDEQTKATAPAPASTPAVAPPPVAAAVASPAPRPARAAADASTAAAGDVVAEDAPVDAPEAPLEGRATPVDAPRVRDVIERAQPVRAEGQAGPAAESDATPSPDAADAAPAAVIPNAPSRPAPAAAPAAVPVVVGADTTATSPVATAPQPTETRPADTAVSQALSTLSQATIETTAQIAAQIVRKLEGRSTRFEMALTPEGLGQVDVSLDIDADGKLAARMAFDNPLAATELRGRVDELRRQLQDAGFTVADDALSFAERDASAGQQGGSAFDRQPDPRNARAFGAASRLQAEADRMATPAAWIPLTLTPDRVDMKV